MRFPLPARVLPVLGLVAIAACSDSSTAPAVVPTDLTTALSEMSLSTFMPSTAGIGTPVPLVQAGAASCAYNGTVQSFVCAPVSTGGLTINSSYTLLSASGASLAAFDAATTAAIRSTMTAAGTVGTGTNALTIDERQELTLSGLLTGKHVLDGVQVAHITGIVSTQKLETTATTTIVGLVPPEHAGPGSYPRAGTITMTIVDPALALPGSTGFTITMKFNGTSKVDVTMTGFGPTQRCVIDLAASSRAGLGCA